MKVLENLFDGNPTIFDNGRIINGCQDFTLDEAPAVFEEYNVPLEIQQDVYDNYVETTTEEEVQEYLKTSPCGMIRILIAELGVGLSVLINDSFWAVREAVAKQGYGLDKLINDEDWYVRITVAQQDYGLDVLINDGDWRVRRAVAEQGYGLDVLINDESLRVQAVARASPKRMN